MVATALVLSKSNRDDVNGEVSEQFVQRVSATNVMVSGDALSR